MTTLHGTTERIRDIIHESEICIMHAEECIECLESRINDKHIDIIYNRGRIDLAEELIEMIGIKELPTPAPSTPTHPGNTVSYGVSGDVPSTIKFITQSINDPNVVNVSIAKSDDDDTLFRIDVLRGIEGIVTGFHISVKRNAETGAASVARDADIRIKLATALHHTMTHYMKSVIARQYPDSDFPQVSFDDLAAADKQAPLRDADTILDIIRSGICDQIS